VNKIIQKTHLSVDEKGTTAASSTTTEAIPVKSQLPRKNKVNLVANRPFIFLVYDDEGKSILFFGRLVRPK
jgi:serpin B